MAKKIDSRDALYMGMAAKGVNKGTRADKRNPLTMTATQAGALQPRAKQKPGAAAIQAALEETFDADHTTLNSGSPMSGDEDARARHAIRRGWFLAEAHRQASNRARMARCEAYYDNEQWVYEDAQTLRDRGQVPTTYNEIKPTIDWLIGTERRTRVDFVVMAQDEGDEADDDATAKTKILKYLDVVNGTMFERSYAADDAFKAGIGWIEVGLRSNPQNVPIFIGSESWRNILWDSQCKKPNLSDARYVFRIKVVDYDIALAIFPDKETELKRVQQTGDSSQVMSEWFGGLGGIINGLDDFNKIGDQSYDNITNRPVDLFNARKRVLLLECWSREPVPRSTTKDGLNDPVRFQITCSIMTECDTLVEGPSPYKHNRFPFIPLWSYRNKATGLPYSPIFPLLGPQDSLNRRQSKALFEASKNQIELEKSAIAQDSMNLDELRTEYNDPNGMPVLADGALTGNKVRHVESAGSSAQQLELAAADREAIRGVSGVSADNRGINSNVVSGKAVLAKQDQGSLLTAELFDNALMMRQMEGEMTLSLVEQFMVQPATIRVPGDGSRGEFVKINQPKHKDASGKHVPNPSTGQYEYLNDISARQAHFVVGEQAWKQNYAEAAFDSLFQVLGQLATAAPQVVINLLDIVFEMHPNLPKKRQIIQRIRMINGQIDPDTRPTAQQLQQQQQKQQQAEMQMQLSIQMLQNKVNLAQAQGKKIEADTVQTLLSSIYEAAQAAAVLAVNPQASPIADELLRSSGFQDNQEPQVIQQPTMPPLAPTGPATAQPMGTPQLPNAIVPPNASNVPQLPAPPVQPVHPVMPAGAAAVPPGQPVPPALRQTDGALAGHLQGIHTNANDGLEGATK